jgi:hypothetical protein
MQELAKQQHFDIELSKTGVVMKAHKGYMFSDGSKKGIIRFNSFGGSQMIAKHNVYFQMKEGWDVYLDNEYEMAMC